MFLRYYVEVALPAAALADVLVQDPARWMPALAGHADQHARRLMLEVGFPVDHHRAGKRVELELGQPVHTQARTWLPLSWRATGARGLFPALEGELEVAALGKELTQVGLSARYKPPFGLLGESLDRVLLHRVAEATVRDFVQRIAAELERLARKGTEDPALHWKSADGPDTRLSAQSPKSTP